MNTSEFFFSNAILTDFKMYKTGLDASYFPGIPDTIEIHAGFKAEHERLAMLLFV